MRLWYSWTSGIAWSPQLGPTWLVGHVGLSFQKHIRVIASRLESSQSWQWDFRGIVWESTPRTKKISSSRMVHGRRQWHPTPVLLPGKSHGWRSLVGCSPWGPKELDTTERLHFHFSLSCIGEGNGNPLQCSCLENPRDGGAWRAAVYGVPQSRTWLKRLSSSSRMVHSHMIQNSRGFTAVHGLPLWLSW